ncbi:hypothetical protein IQ264_01675 [Phormidium sp. LEGE 05292]|uniref:hypothetical protein n=1 Tax=[Phormidium] sp. LEGE 05292 TaxID=767427 RepID=UPI001882EBE8|nr:hypothetical protein [Phormidium sp. LEGE 05292]MBE9224182.1 hypothetical protein [Phormidium sp. LEGE 05292]
MEIVQSVNEIETEVKFLFDLDVEVNLIVELTENEEITILKQRKNQLSKLFDVTPEQVDNPDYWINL